MWFWILTHTRQKCKKVRSTTKNNAYKEMHDAQMHEDIAFNACRVLQRAK